jgi:hypothetical protein
MAEFFQLPFGVRVAGPEPVDGDRYIATSIAVRDSIVTNARGYNGLLCYVESEKNLYILDDVLTNTWRLIASDVSSLYAYIDGSLNNIRDTYIPDTSLGYGLEWNPSGFLDVSINVSPSTILTFDASIEGDDITTSFPIIHNLNTMRQNIEIWDFTTNEVIYPAITKGLTTDYVSFYTPPSTGTIYNINIIGF